MLLVSIDGVARVVSIGSSSTLTSFLFSTILSLLLYSISILVALENTVGYTIKSSIKEGSILTLVLLSW
ncbi:6773_t:CDS:1, partial [Dentiscutata erythropus]